MATSRVSRWTSGFPSARRKEASLGMQRTKRNTTDVGHAGRLDITTAAGASPSVTQHRAPTRKRGKRQVGLVFIAPFGLLFMLVYIIPIMYAAYLSLFQQKLIGGNTFTGLANYAKLFR